jgi:hypothetical protein
MAVIYRKESFIKVILKTANMTLSFLFSVILFSNSNAQFYSGGDDPSYIRWNQIRTDHFKVIYPSDFVSEARRLTSLLEFYYEKNSAGLNHQPAKFPVILHNHSVYTNGFVAVAPKRMELITTPASDSYSQEHFEQLVLHEFRHVVQVDKLNQSVTRVMKYILGEQAQGAVAGLMPFWYLEGDAVDAETVLSNSGRGRQPSFERGIKAILLENNKMYSYEKSYYGSYRDFVPSHYAYGYQMVAHARQKYGNDIWTKMVDFTAKNPYTLYPFYFGLKKYTGLSKSGLYKETIRTLKEHWIEQYESRFLSDYTVINSTACRDFTSYQFPAYINDSLIFALKSGIDQIDKFILIDRKGREKAFFTPGYIDPANISLSGGLVVWSEYKSNERWENESYAIIKTYNLKSGEKKTISRRSRYYAPEISPDTKKIVVTEVSLLNEYALVILDSKDGKVLEKIPSQGNEFLQYPVWSKDENRIFVTSMGKYGKSIKSYDLITGAWSMIFDPVYDDIAELSAGNKYLLFRGTFSGIDNIYAIELSTGKCYQVTSSKLGAYYPHFSANNDKILYSDYTSHGFDIAETEFNERSLDPLDFSADNDEQLYKPAENADLMSWNKESGSVTLYPEKKYSKIGHLFNIHSWSPFYFDYENPDIENPSLSPGVTILSQNLLNTAFTTLGYEYRDHDHFIHASFTYRGLYPIFRFSYDFGGLPFIADPPEGYNMPDWVLTNMNWNLKIYLPLHLSSGKYVRGLQPSAESRFSRSYMWYDEPAGYRTGLTFLNYRLYTYNYLRTSNRDILPRWGQVADINFIHAPFNTSQIGYEVSLNGTLYLPGFLQHHTLRIGAGFQNQKTEKYILNNLISMPRGYETLRSEELIKLTADYVFPLIYPDLNIWHLLYIKRIKAAIFYDHGLGYKVHVPSGDTYERKDLIFRSFGFDLTSDFNLAHILFPFDMGIRFSYPLDDAKPKWELLMSININDFR